jgi:hypothetical protein
MFEPIRTAAPNAPAYREAYPRLNVAAAIRAVREGNSVCGFERRRPIGHLSCREISVGLIIEYEIIPDGFGLRNAKGEQGFKLIREDRSAVAAKIFLRCPVCLKSRQSVFFGRAWACAECHRLLRRSQVIPRGVVVREQRDELRSRVSRGRPSGMHSSTYARMRNMLEQLETTLKKLPERFPSEGHCQTVSEEWLSLEKFEAQQTDPSSRWFRDGL